VTEDRGRFTNPPEFLAERPPLAARAGFATTIHAIGDAAVRTGLDILGPTALTAAFMPRLEHVQLCDPADRGRFASLGVAASVQPIHRREDAGGARRDWGDRAETAGYAWRSILEAGGTVAFGQDAPLEPLDPWPGIALSVLRRDPSWGAGEPAFGAHEAISLEQALRASIVGPWQTVREPLGGRLVEGALADVMVLPSMPEEELLRSAEFGRIRPRLVLLDGEVVFER
jgi:predicted amidohydrolase YtcJ